MNSPLTNIDSAATMATLDKPRFFSLSQRIGRLGTGQTHHRDPGATGRGSPREAWIVDQGAVRRG